MLYKYVIVAMIACSMLGCVKSSSVKTNKDNAVRAFDDRSTEVYITNWLTGPTSKMTLIDRGIDNGEFKTSPASSIAFNSTGHTATQSTSWLQGAGGWVRYRVENDGAILKFSWYNPYAGSNSYEASSNIDDYYFTREGGSGNNASTTWYVRRKAQPAPVFNYSAIIMADAQPWRLNPAGDPNSDSTNGNEWRNINRNTFNSILSHSDVRFHIHNGDLSEYGRKAQYQDYYDIYHSSGVFVTEGLGNHDYANNVGKCADLSTGSTSQNGCAVSAVAREYTAIQNIKNNIAQIPGSSFSSDITKSTFSTENSVEDTYQGSLAYSWDVGDIHYVQLQNYPGYTLRISAPYYGSAYLTSSLPWLANDLESASRRGKDIIINFHDARPYYGDNDSHFLSPENSGYYGAFKMLITFFNVKAIFVGHTHQQAYCRAKDDAAFGNVPVYTAGALFNGDYYLLDVQGKKINVKAYNGKTGSPQLVKDLGTIGSDTTFSNTCSNL